MAISDEKKIEMPRERIWINLEIASKEGFDIVRTKLGIFDRPMSKHGRPEMQAAASGTSRSLNNVKNVVLDEVVTDLLKLGYVVTGAPAFEDRQADGKIKRRIRIWFSKPENLGTPDLAGDLIMRDEALETRFVAFLKESVATYVHVKDDNADGSACIIAITLKPRDGSSTQSLRFGQVTADGFAFYHEPTSPERTRIESPRRAGLTATFGDVLRQKLGA